MYRFELCKFECPELRKFHEKLCTLYVQIARIYKKCDLYRYVECIELRKSNENCVH